MDSFEWNKIAGASLFALLVAFGLGIFSGILFETEAPESPGYVIALAEPGEGAGGEAPASQPIGVLLASADPAAGANSVRKCAACHTFGKDEPNRVGPNLWDIVERPIASHEGYEYDEAMHAFAEEAGTWTYDHLSEFLQNPAGTVPGTKMAFAGLKDDAERANVIAHLRTLSDNPKPLPEAEPGAEEQAALAEGEAPAAAEGEAPAAAGGEAASETAAAEPEAPAEGPETATAAPDAGGGADGATSPASEETAQAEPAPAAPAPAAEAPALAAGEQAPSKEAGSADVAAGGESAFAPMVAAADVAKGESFARRCIACHSFEEGGPNQVGPYLWNVVNRPIASVPDYAYSDAMKEFSGGGAKVWDYDTLSTFLADPRGVVPGTKMVFPGIKAEEDRANVVAYLRSLAAEPAPLPAQ